MATTKQEEVEDGPLGSEGTHYLFDVIVSEFDGSPCKEKYTDIFADIVFGLCELHRRRKPYTTSDHLVAIIFLILLVACRDVAILGGWRGSALMSTGIQSIFSVTNTDVAEV
ncbi:hypothetical protein SmJEL517_g05754 [Synchytrium microbalum]|uniref:Uncharacterized protein n=1 Tax=Synchytrium microbalum TaxID=1806994 RepID=A0A507BTX5_9FUNG|nr:uncharacterized protein SmJEL517_g05754 [Synchytrium microbalum]TPX30768.1 hypothetical protein SmJEL517_g05754 [Synchytrium microbalum]